MGFKYTSCSIQEWESEGKIKLTKNVVIGGQLKEIVFGFVVLLETTEKIGNRLTGFIWNLKIRDRVHTGQNTEKTTE